MYVIDGIAYAGEPNKPIQAVSVRPLDGRTLWIRFSTGEEKTFDFAPLLDQPAFAPLRDRQNFQSVYVDYGVPLWLDGQIDIAPEKLYDEGVPVDPSFPRHSERQRRI